MMSLSRAASPSWRAIGNASSNSAMASRGLPSLRMMIPRSVSAVTSRTRSPARRALASACSACFRGLSSIGGDAGGPWAGPFPDDVRPPTPLTRNSRGPSRRSRRASGHRDRTRSSSRASAGSSGQASRQSTDRSPACSTDTPFGSTKDRFPFPSPNRPSSLPSNPRVLRPARILVADVEQSPPLTATCPRATLPIRSQAPGSPSVSAGSQTINRLSSDSDSRRILGSRITLRQSGAVIRVASHWDFAG